MPSAHPTDKQWIRRCFDLAKRGIGYVSPNPPVGAILVYKDQILGEGYHTFFGGPHAEVEALQNVPSAKKHLLTGAVLYVSLEPCCIYGKTPPCTDLILREGIKDVRISSPDPNPLVAGKGIEILRSHGVDVTTGILENEGKELIRAFSTNILRHRPHVILKWAQSHDLYIGKKEERIMISHPYTTAWSHSLRSAADTIIVGARTVTIDNPKLTTRDSPGPSAHRAVYDPAGRLTQDYHVFTDDDRRVFYFSTKENPRITGAHIFKNILSGDSTHVVQILSILFSHQTGILLVEGGSYLIDLFIKEHQWDEAWVIRSVHPLDEGIRAPIVKGKMIGEILSAADTITGIKNEEFYEKG